MLSYLFYLTCFSSSFSAKESDTIVKIGKDITISKIELFSNYIIQPEDSLSQLFIVINDTKNVNIQFDDDSDESSNSLVNYIPGRTIGYRFENSGKVHVTPTSNDAFIQFAAISLSEYCTGDVYLNTKADTRLDITSVPSINSCYFFLGNLSQKTTSIYSIGSNSFEVYQGSTLTNTSTGDGSLMDVGGFYRTTSNSQTTTYRLTIYGDSNSGPYDYEGSVNTGHILGPGGVPPRTPQPTSQQTDNKSGDNTTLTISLIVAGAIIAAIIIIVIVYFVIKKTKKPEYITPLLL